MPPRDNVARRGVPFLFKGVLSFFTGVLSTLFLGGGVPETEVSFVGCCPHWNTHINRHEGPHEATNKAQLVSNLNSASRKHMGEPDARQFIKIH